MATPNIRTPALGVMKFTILVDPFLVIITTYLVYLIYDLCLGREKKIFKEIMQLHYDIYGHTLAQEPLPQGS